LDRLAAAYQGVELFDVSKLPKILEILATLSEESKKTSWGIGMSPCTTAHKFTLSRDKSEIRPLLDSTWIYPKENLKYPISIQEKNEAPWPWQVEQTLWIFLDEIISRNIDESWFNTLIKMPCERDSQANLIAYAIRRLIRVNPQLTLSIYRNILLNPKFIEAHVLFDIPWDVGRATLKWLPNDKTIDTKLAYAFIYDVLENSPNLSAKYSAESWIKKEIWHNAKDEPQLPFKSTVILFLSQKVLAEESSGNTNPLDRAFTVAKLAEKPPFAPGNDWGYGYYTSNDSNQRIKYLKKFRDWFNEHSGEIKETAKEEAKEISIILDGLKGCSLCSE
jgi:hypothetical protein